MNWLIVVFFAGVYADGTQDSYIFERPSFETKAECMNAATDKKQIDLFVQKLLIDVGRRDIHKVVCTTENQIRAAIKLSNGGSDT
tara:strand:- start:395 stop:649 length:255 start_codon:yes stop_codon:yes gene_type:complete